MDTNSFYSLRIGQKIWYKGEEKTVRFLCIHEDDIACCGTLSFERDSCFRALSWKDVCQNCSLGPPKQKRKYWIWKVKFPAWYKITSYIDEEGKDTEGVPWFTGTWNKLEKIKCEDDWIEA